VVAKTDNKGRPQYFHGTGAAAAASILTDGFHLGRERWGRGLGRGVYLSGSSRFAATWGEFIVVCELAPGTRILWHAEPDPRVIASLRREFGRGVTGPDFWKYLPANKQLCGHELVHLWNHLLSTAYLGPRHFRRGRFDRLCDNYPRIYEHLRRHGYDGVGFRDDDWPEMLVFNPSRVLPKAVHRWRRAGAALGAPIPAWRLRAMQQRAARADEAQQR